MVNIVQLMPHDYTLPVRCNSVRYMHDVGLSAQWQLCCSPELQSKCFVALLEYSVVMAAPRGRIMQRLGTIHVYIMIHVLEASTVGRHHAAFAPAAC